MKRNPVVVALDITIGVVLLYYMLMLLFPEGRVYILNYLRTLRYEWWKIKLPAWKAEAFKVRGNLQ